MAKIRDGVLSDDCHKEENGSPFKSGARCALRHGENYTEVFVDRVHKSGNFTLRDRGSQQWRPFSSGWSGEARWSAHETGNHGWGGSRTSLVPWDATTDAEITAAVAEQRLTNRLYEVKKRVERLRRGDVSDSYLLALELALPPTAPNVEKS